MNPASLEETIAKLSKELESLRQQVSQQPATPRVSEKGVKVNDPEEFRGDRTKSRAFMLQCENKFSAEPTRFSSDGVKIHYVISFLRGSAFQWVTPYLDYQRSYPSETQPLFSSLNSFFTEFLKIFDDPNRKVNAEKKLFELRQGKRSVTTLVSEFQMLVVEAGFKFDNPSLFGMFYKSLNNEVKDELIKQDRPLDLSEYFQLAINIDDRLFQRRQEKKADQSSSRFSFSSRNTFHSSAPVPARAKTPGPVPMELDATSAVSGRGKLSKSEREHRMKNGLCLYCGESGHRVVACPARNSLSATMSGKVNARQ